MINRKLSESGINPLAAYVLGLAGFVLIAEYLFYKTEFAKYIVVLATFTLLLKASEINRSEFLMLVFGNKKYRLIRMTENLVLALPFSILLICHVAIIEALSLLVACLILANLSFKTTFNFSMPTPFYRKPFEFVVGFRNTFFMFPLIYILSYISLSVDNLNLGVLSMLGIFLVSLSYYSKPENEYYVWSYSCNAAQFIFKKLITATLYSGLLALPIIFSLILFYPQDSLFILLFLLIGFSFLWTFVLAKYAAYPNEMNITEGILIAISLPFPPLLILLIPYFYTKAIKSLNPILE